MKKVAYSIAAVALISLFAACKNDVQNTLTSNEFPADASHDLAVADIGDAENPSAQYLYVTAPSGLTLREYNNLNSDKLARMPYGTRVEVLTSEENATMTVGGIRGAMNEVAFNHQKGFAFTGYLSKFFPPEPNINAKIYADDLQQLFPIVSFSETIGGTVSEPVNTQTLSLPTTQWHEAFFIAQRLFDFPKEFAFPNQKGTNSETLFDGKPKKGIWKSELQITRKDNTLEKIEYVYGSETFDSTVSIVQDGETMKITKSETIK